MLNRWASLAMSTSVLKALPDKLDIKRHPPSILYILETNLVFSISLSGMSYKVSYKEIELYQYFLLTYVF